MLKVSITTLGCKVNQYDSAAIRELMERRGFKFVSPEDSPQVCIINTCTVTSSTSYQSRQEIRRCQRMNPQATIVVTGCYAQANPEEVSKIPGVNYVIGNDHKTRIPDILIGDICKGAPPQVWVGEIGSVTQVQEPGVESFGGRTRAFLKIQDGCDYFCSYCIIPFTRGRSRSLPLDEVKARIKRLADVGFKEVVLTGVQLGGYGPDLARLVGEIEAMDLPIRVRLSSLEPNCVTPELIGHLMKGKKICQHLHLPLQSGDNYVLERMRRPYRREYFSRLVLELVEKVPDICIGTDIIVGFPGEGEESFRNTYNLVAELPISYVHVFPYSVREGTLAASLPEPVSPRLIKERSQALRELAVKKRRRFYERFLGREVLVLVENTKDRRTGRLKGHSRNYLPIMLHGEDSLMNQEVPVRITSVYGDEVMGELC